MSPAPEMRRVLRPGGRLIVPAGDPLLAERARQTGASCSWFFPEFQAADWPRLIENAVCARALGGRFELVRPGGQLLDLGAVAEALDNWRDRSRVSGRKLLQVWELSKPVIAAVNGWCIGGGSWYALACHMTYASEDAVFAQPEVRMISNTSFFWTLKAGYKHALRYGLTGDHIDAQEALRIGILNDIVPKDELIDYCFDIVERIAKVSPETVKINLQVATKGLHMMGLGNALALNEELSAQVHTSQREDFKRHLQEAQKQGGMRAFLKQRDDPFRPEPFGPKSQSRNG